MTKHLLLVLMDGIKDAEMLLDYTEEAMNIESPTMTWFKNHAKDRIDCLAKDYDYISNQIGLSERAREGDEIAEALIGHINFQMSELNKRYISM